MTDKQLQLINRCIDEVHVEVGWINGVNPRTAESLVEKGVLVYDFPSQWRGSPTLSVVRLRLPDEG